MPILGELRPVNPQPLLTGLDGELAAHVAAALTRYAHWLKDVDRPLPEGFAELLNATCRVAKSGQLRRSAHLTGDAVRMGYLIGTADAAAVLGCSERTVRRRVVDGTLQVRRIGRLVRFDPNDLLTLLEAA